LTPSTPALPELPPVPKDGIPLAHARSRLASVWLTAAGVIFGLLILQSLLGKYEKRVQQAWSWALPTMMPTLTLMISVLGADALKAAAGENAYVKKNFYHIAFWMSLAYLSLILVTILIEPFVCYSSLDLFNLSNLWLGPFQGLVASTFGDSRRGLWQNKEFAVKFSPGTVTVNSAGVTN
jgi:hypothetical protein